MTAILADKRERWLAARRLLVTATDVVAILRPVLGYDHHRGPLDAYCSKVGIAARFGVRERQVSKVKSRRSWRSVA